MGMFLRSSVFLWISVGFLSTLEKSEACTDSGFPDHCEFVFRNVCFEFVGGSETWSQARDSCEKRGGELLKVLNSPTKMFLKNITREGNISKFTWWLGEGAQGRDQEPNIETADSFSTDTCAYMKLDSLQPVLTSDCNQRRGFLCTYEECVSSTNTTNTVVSSQATRSRPKRSPEDMTNAIGDIDMLLKAAHDELRRMETTVGEPADSSRDTFIKNLLEGTKLLTPDFALANNDTLSDIIKCGNGIFHLSQKKCDLANPNPESLFEDVFEIFREIAMLVGKATSEDIVFQHPAGTIYQSIFAPGSLDPFVLGSEKDGDFVIFPPFASLESQIGQPSNVIAQLATFTENPHPSDDNITGPVSSVILSDGINDIKLKDLPEMIEIFLPQHTPAELMKSSLVLEKGFEVMTSINVSDPNLTIFFSVETSANVSLELMLSEGSRPSVTYFNASTSMSPTGGYRWMITPTMMQQTPGVWYIATSLNSTWQEGLMINITMFSAKCSFWDVEQQRWSSEGCQVGEKSTPMLMHCLCNHLTLFGSAFFVMPNYVDLSRTAVLFATVSDNYVVLALLCAFFGVYLLTLMWACYADRKSRSKRKLTLLEDNHPGALYNYLIGVQTGRRKNAGTTANVTMKLIGSEGETDTQELTDPDKPVFERGAVDMFVLATPFPLGEVQNLKLQHDNSGGHPSWYIHKVTIQDLQTHQVFHFFCDCWLSDDRGDNMTKKTFNAAKNNEVASFRNIFQTRTSTGFRDEHIWVSIVDPPTRSPFTRAQRVSCCMSLLLCTMAINIAFWNIPIDENSTVLFELGSMQITWQELMVGIQSGLLMFPINILIITIFRSIRPRVISKSQKGDSENANRPAVTIATILKETEEMISYVSKSPRNKIPEMPRLESTTDLGLALDRLNEFIQLMQGETVSDPHWVNCSKFLLIGLCHLLLCLEKLDEKHFPSPQEYQQTLNVTNLLVRKAEMVFSSHLASCPTPVVRKKRKVASFWLPWWCVFLGWFLLLAISVVSTFFTLLYGFKYGKEKSIKWVMSLGLSLFQSIFILQPLKVIGIAVFFALLLKPVAMDESEEIEQVKLAQQEKCRKYCGRDTL